LISYDERDPHGLTCGLRSESQNLEIAALPPAAVNIEACHNVIALSGWAPTARKWGQEFEHLPDLHLSWLQPVLEQDLIATLTHPRPAAPPEQHP
jgi:hypothetical protein